MKEAITLILALAVVIVMIFLTAKLTKWFNKKTATRGFYGNTNGITIIERLAISSDKQLMVVKIGEKSLLLGVTPNSISKISELDENDVMLLKASSETSANGFDSFKNIFAKAKNTQDKNGSDWEVNDNSDEEKSL